MVITASGLAEYARTTLSMPTVYLWGGAMRLVTDSYLAALAARYPYWYHKSNLARLRAYAGTGYFGVDGAGLVKSYYWGGAGSKNYRAATDLDADALFRQAPETGPLFSLPETPGLCVWRRGQVGIYTGKGRVVMAAADGTRGAVRQTPLWGRGWTHWFRSPYVSYTEDGMMSQDAFNKMFARAMEEYLRSSEGGGPVSPSA